ncbi:MAG: HAD-IC family P-type ATPase, partial [Burkholderiaceae bacterium]|nr:HAD-IC family P-type ATPase [Burkholderiaceae bacterium]
GPRYAAQCAARGDAGTGGAARPPPVALDLRHEAGRGVQASVDGVELRLGSDSFAGEWVQLPDAPGACGSQVWLVSRSEPLARFVSRDALRADARPTLDALRSLGLRLHLLSGDHPEMLAGVAGELRVDSARGGVSPAGKTEEVRAMQREGAVVMMVGEGVNDAPVLAAADVSVAVGRASALARTAADAVLLAPHLDRVVTLVQAARRTRRVIAQNLVWAGAYNATAIPAAAMGWVAPWVAALGMSASSLLVAANALRLLRTSTPPTAPPAARAGARVAPAAGPGLPVQ